jgi:hypothetical protein
MAGTPLCAGVVRAGESTNTFLSVLMRTCLRVFDCDARLFGSFSVRTSALNVVSTFSPDIAFVYDRAPPGPVDVVDDDADDELTAGDDCGVCTGDGTDFRGVCR